MAARPEPVVNEDSRESVIRWLSWNDPNGCYTDEARAVEDYDPLTLEEALEERRQQLKDAEPVALTVTLPGGLVVERLAPIDREEEPHNLLGTVKIAGCPFHFQAVKVRWSRDEHEQQAVHDPHDRLGDLDAVDQGGRRQVVNIPGFDGDFVVVLYPFGG